MTLTRFIGALEENLRIYSENFGGIPQMPTPKDSAADRDTDDDPDRTPEPEPPIKRRHVGKVTEGFRLWPWARAQRFRMSRNVVQVFRPARPGSPEGLHYRSF